MSRLCSALGVMVLVVVLPVAAVYGATSPAAKCAIAKNKASAKKLSAKAKCYQKAVAKGMGVDATCLMAAETKFNAAITKAEAGGACPIPGDGVTLEALINRQVADLDTFTPAVLPVCCFDGVGACWYGATAGDCTPFAAGAAGTVCDGATGGCVAVPGTPGPCCSNSAGLTTAAPSGCDAGPEWTSGVCAGVGGNLESNGLCPPVASAPVSSNGPTCVHF